MAWDDVLGAAFDLQAAQAASATSGRGDNSTAHVDAVRGSSKQPSAPPVRVPPPGPSSTSSTAASSTKPHAPWPSPGSWSDLAYWVPFPPSSSQSAA